MATVSEGVTVAIAALSAIGGAGAMWGAVRVQVKQLEKNADKMESRIDKHDEQISEIKSSIVGIETNTALLLERSANTTRGIERLLGLAGAKD